MCDCKKNQTSEEVFDFLRDKKFKISDVSLTGFGLFLVPAPENGILEWRTTFVERLTYSETRKRGENCAAWQWIPTGIVAAHSGLVLDSIAAIENSRKACSDSKCKATGCTMGCWCYSSDIGKDCQTNP